MPVSLKEIIYAIRTIPTKQIPLLAIKVLRREFEYACCRQRDKLLPSFNPGPFQKGARLQALFKPPSINFLSKDKEQILALTNNYLAHKFDLLGSGWIEVKHGMICRGLEGHTFPSESKAPSYKNGQWLRGCINKTNLSHSQKIWEGIGPNYNPIDWSIDFKSGFRWKVTDHYECVKYGHLLGVDIKVPWELAKMQSLPQLAWAYILAKESFPEFKEPEIYSQEFRNQVLDFIASNPPRFGVNWYCPMDIGIRAANLLTAYDLFKSAGAIFDVDFENFFLCSIYQHGQHILNNFEWKPKATTNHYLANIAGLVFISAHLPKTPETDSWLGFSVQELIAEMEFQFHPEGTNFEGSTCYHRLSAEMMIYSTALILGLPESKIESLKTYDPQKVKVPARPNRSPLKFYSVPDSSLKTPFPHWFMERLEKLAKFTAAITKPDGLVPQIGDNDSGRFLKLSPVFYKSTVREVKKRYKNLENFSASADDQDYWVEEHLDHSHLVNSINALFQNSIFEQKNETLESEIIRKLAGDNQWPSFQSSNQPDPSQSIRVGDNRVLEYWLDKFFASNANRLKTHEIPVSGIDLLTDLNLHAFPEFGLYCYKSKFLYLTIRCGRLGINAPTGHIHNDQLSIELSLEGTDWIKDPGTYLYTPLPQRRNQYRSVKAHYAPCIENREPNSLEGPLFQLTDNSKPKCLFFGEKGFLGTHSGFGSPIYRMILIKERRLVIHDYIDGPETLISEPPTQGSSTMPFSNGYGLVLL